MKRIALLIVLLLKVAAHADELSTSPALQEQLREVERQFVRSGVPQDDAEATVRAMVQSRFTVEQVVRTGKQLVSDERRGIMGQAVRNKIHEGLAKGIPPESILSATERVRNRFASAAKLAAELNEPRNASIVNTYADCLAAGLTEQHAQRLTTALNDRSGVAGGSGGKSLAIETLLTTRAMVRRNISSATTTGVMESALSRGYSGEEMRTLRHSLADSSLDLEETAMRFGKAIDQGLRAGELQGLGGNSRGTGSDMGAGQGASGGSGGSSGSGGSGGSGSGSGDGGSGGSGGSDGGSGGSGGSDGGSGGSGGSDGGSGGSGGNGGGSGGGSGGGHS